MTVIVDYGVGNLFSLRSSFASLGVEVTVSGREEDIRNADRIIVMDDGRVAMDGTPKEVFTQVEELRSMGLTVPDTVDLLDRLRHSGVDVPLDALTVEACADVIAQAIARN